MWLKEGKLLDYFFYPYLLLKKQAKSPFVFVSSGCPSLVLFIFFNTYSPRKCAFPLHAEVVTIFTELRPRICLYVELK